MLKIEFHGQFKRDYKLAVKRGCDVNRLNQVVKLLANQQPLPAQYKDHRLTGQYQNMRECHIQPNWLLIYQVQEELLVLRLIRTGSHSDLF